MNFQSVLNFLVGCLLLWASCHSPIQQQSKASVMEVDYSTEISNNHSLDFPESNSFNEDHRSYLISSIDNTHIWPTE